ncbi:hypothetical protein ABK040_011211 [Willaertia magna]
MSVNSVNTKKPLNCNNKLKSLENNKGPKIPTSGKTTSTRINKKVSSLSSSFPQMSVEERELRKNIIKLPSDVLLKILEYYGGEFDQSCGSSIKKFIKLYFGKFTKTEQQDSSPKFLFRQLKLVGKMYHKSELLKLVQSIGASGYAFKMKYPFTKILENDNSSESKDLQKKHHSLIQTSKILKVLPVENITSLVIKQSQISQESLRLCLQTMANNLTEINLIQDIYKMYEFNTLFKDIKFPKLKIFKWKGRSLLLKEVNAVLNESEEQDLIDFSLNTPSLTTLDIQTNIFSVFRFSKAIKNWTNLRSVKSVMIGESGGSMQGWITLYDQPSESARLEFFENLKNTKLTSLSFDHEKIYIGMLRLLLHIPLKSIELSYCGYIYDYIQLLSIKSLRRLKVRTFIETNETLDSNTEINCDLEELFVGYTPKLTIDCFIKFKNLKRLTIYEQGINNKFIESISTQLPLLEYIDLSNNPVTNNGIITLVKNCKNLKTIRASECRLTTMSLPNEIKDVIVQ